MHEPAGGESRFLQPVFGTMERDAAPDADQGPMLVAIKAALENGFRHLDCAELYQTNREVGQALAESGVDRSEVWLTSKLEGLPMGEYGAVKARVEALLALNRTEYFDLLLVHHPLARGADLGGDPGSVVTPDAWEWFQQHLEEAWANMSQLRAEGLVRNVGVSNFNAVALDELAKHATGEGRAPIFANQVFIDAAHDEAELMSKMQSMGVRVMAYRPLAFCNVYPMLEGLGDALQAKADSVGAPTTHDLVLRWLLARGVVPVTTSLDPAHMVTNLANKDALGEHAAALAATPLVPELAEQREMIDMYGGADEYAAAFMSFGIAG